MSSALLRALCVACTAQAACAPGLAAETRTPSAWAPDSWFLQLGQAPRTDTSSLMLGATWHWQGQWQVGRGRLSGYWELSLGRWSTPSAAGRRSAWVTQWGVTPVWRWQPDGSPWFAELGIGANLITPLYRGESREFSTAFNFGDHLALGRQWPASEPGLRELSLRVQHFSNAGIRRPNPGEDFVQLRAVWGW